MMATARIVLTVLMVQRYPRVHGRLLIRNTAELTSVLLDLFCRTILCTSSRSHSLCVTCYSSFT